MAQQQPNVGAQLEFTPVFESNNNNNAGNNNGMNNSMNKQRATFVTQPNGIPLF